MSKSEAAGPRNVLKKRQIRFRAWRKLPKASLEEWFGIQKASYEVEAQLLGYAKLPPLVESFCEFRESPDRWLVSYCKGKPAGALAFQIRKHVEITRLFVSPDFFRLGIASGLVERLQAKYPGKRYLVATGSLNIPARRLYAKCGFREVEEFETRDGVAILKLVC